MIAQKPATRAFGPSSAVTGRSLLLGAVWACNAGCRSEISDFLSPTMTPHPSRSTTVPRLTSPPFLLLALLLLLLDPLPRALGACPQYQYLQLVPLPSPPPAPVAAALARVNASLAAFLDPVSQPGFVASVWYNGAEVASWGAGVADKSSGRAPQPARDLFRIASNTKLFVALLAEVFAERGLIRSLDDPVALYAPAFAGPINTFGDGALISFRMLASHTASLPDSLPGGADWGANLTTQQVFDAIAALPATVPFGTLPSYSNLGIALLGHVLAEFVAEPFERGDVAPLLEKYVLAPLGLTPNTGYDLTDFAQQNLIPAYDGAGARVPLETLGWDAPCGTMWSSIPNLARFHQATAAAVAGAPAPAGFSLSAARARAWLQPVSLTPDNSIVIGQPWETFVLPSADGGFVVRTKSGTLNGYSTKSALVAELRLSFAFSFNGNFKDWYAGNGLLESVAGELVPAFTQALLALQPPRAAGARAADYVGTYAQAANPANVATVALDGRGQLVLSAAQTLGPPAVLEAVGAAAPEVFRMFQDTSGDSCEHPAMADTAPLPPSRPSTGTATG